LPMHNGFGVDFVDVLPTRSRRPDKLHTQFL